MVTGMLQHRGMQTFLVIWTGQFISILGTAMTRFALMIWAYNQAGNATTLAMIGFFNFGGYLLASPFAGVLVDRWNRRTMMFLADVFSGLMTLAMLVLFLNGRLEIWHLYLGEALSGAFEAFQMPAYYSSVSLLAPPEHYARLNGMVSFANNSGRVFAPMLAGLLLVRFDLGAIMIVDIVTLIVALGTLLVVRIPSPPPSMDGNAARGNFFHQVGFGLKYVFARPGLLGLMLIYTGMNFFATLTYYSILPAMVLARTAASEITLSAVQSALGIGGVIGALLMSTWGGPKSRIHGVLAAGAFSFVIGDFLFAIGRDVSVLFFAAIFSTAFIPLISGSGLAIFQSKVSKDVQGRIFSLRDVIQMSLMPFGFFLAGALADQVFEPAMQPGGTLVEAFGWLVGSGPGAGMGLMFVGTSVLGALICLSGYLVPAIRRVESDLPDAQAADGLIPPKILT